MLFNEEQIDDTKRSTIPHACLQLMSEGNVLPKDFYHLSLVILKDLWKLMNTVGSRLYVETGTPTLHVHNFFSLSSCPYGLQSGEWQYSEGGVLKPGSQNKDYTFLSKTTGDSRFAKPFLREK